MKNKVGIALFVGGLLVAVGVELATFLMRPKLQSIRWAHSSELAFVWYVDLLLLIFVLLALFASLFINKLKFLRWSLAMVLLALIHSNYILWSLECSCENMN